LRVFWILKATALGCIRSIGALRHDLQLFAETTATLGLMPDFG